MKIPPGMLKLFLQSAGVPKSIGDLVEKVEAMGFNAFVTRRADTDDPNWAKFGGDRQGNRTGFWLAAKSPTSRVAIGIFLEGVNDEILEGLLAGVDIARPALPDGAVAANS
jgi:hypothetical protein